MNAIKSVLIGAFVALLGLSAWAEVVTKAIEMKVGETFAVPESLVSGEGWSVIHADKDVAEVQETAAPFTISTVGKMDGETEIIFKKSATDAVVYNIKVATVEMVKKVVNQNADEKTATIQVMSHYLYGRKSRTPKVLYIGTACRSHISGDTDQEKNNAIREAIKTTIDSVAEKADVTCKIVDYASNAYHVKSFTVNQGEKFTSGGSLDVGNNQHAAMLAIYNNILSGVADDEIKNGKRSYDYIVMEFDGSRLGASQSNTWSAYPYQSESETSETCARDLKVAKMLSEYYDLGRVIWVVDDSSTAGTAQIGSGTATKRYFEEGEFFPIQASNFDPGNSPEFIQPKSFRGMMGLLNPDLYLQWVDNKTGALIEANWNAFANNDENMIKDVENVQTSRNGHETVSLLKGHAITKGIGREESNEADHWTTYNNAKAAGALIVSLVHETKLDARVTDCVNGELAIDGDPTLKVATDDPEWNGDSGLWGAPAAGDGVLPVGDNCVTGVVYGITEEYWTKLEIPVKDKGNFLTAGNTAFWWVSNSTDKATNFYDPNVQAENRGARGPALTKVYDFAEDPAAKFTSLHAETNAWTSVLWQKEKEIGRMNVALTPVEKFYDGEAVNIAYKVTDEVTGDEITDATIKYRESGSEAWLAWNASAYKNVTNTTVQLVAEKADYLPVTNLTGAAVLIKPREITATAGSDTKPFDGKPLTCSKYTVTDFASPKFGFVKGEGFKTVKMTADSKITEVGSTNNVIDEAEIVFKDNTDRGNYSITYKTGTLTVTEAPKKCEGNGLCCSDGEPSAHCFAWILRANVKTLLPAKVTVKDRIDSGSMCYDGGTIKGETCKYLVAGVRQFVGIAWRCESACPAGDIAAGEAQYVLWENSSKLPVSAPLSVSTSDGVTTFSSASVLPAATGEEVLFDRFGIQGKAVEAFWPLELDGITLGAMSEAEQERYKQYVGAYSGTLYLAGFGALPSTLPAANFAVINGYCVANWQPECGPTKPEFCEDITSWCAEDDATNVAGYGIWSLTYSSAYSSGTYSLRRIVPARAQIKAE